MDLESLGGNAGGGLFGAILAFLGIKQRLDRQDKAIELKQNADVCIALHRGIDEKFTVLINGQGRIFERLDNINDHLRNGK